MNQRPNSQDFSTISQRLDFGRSREYVAQTYTRERRLLRGNNELTTRLKPSKNLEVVIRRKPIFGRDARAPLYFTTEAVIHGVLFDGYPSAAVLHTGGYWVDELATYHEMEFCEGGDLASKILNMNRLSICLPPAFTLHLLIHLSLSVIYLETGQSYDFASGQFSNASPDWLPILHREIKPSHVYFRYGNSSGDYFHFPEPTLGGFTLAIPTEQALPVFMHYHGDQEFTVDKVLRPFIVKGETFKPMQRIDHEYCPPEFREFPKWCGSHIFGDTSANAYQAGATVFEFATRAKIPKTRMALGGQDIDVDNMAEAVRMLESTGQDRIAIKVIKRLLEANPRKRIGATELIKLIPSLIQARDSKSPGEIPPWLFDNMPAEGKRGVDDNMSRGRHRDARTSGSRGRRRSLSPLHIAAAITHKVSEGWRRLSRSPVGQRIRRTLSTSKLNDRTNGYTDSGDDYDWDFKDIGLSAGIAAIDLGLPGHYDCGVKSSAPSPREAPRPRTADQALPTRPAHLRTAGLFPRQSTRPARQRAATHVQERPLPPPPTEYTNPWGQQAQVASQEIRRKPVPARVPVSPMSHAPATPKTAQAQRRPPLSRSATAAQRHRAPSRGSTDRTARGVSPVSMSAGPYSSESRPVSPVDPNFLCDAPISRRERRPTTSQASLTRTPAFRYRRPSTSHTDRL